MNNRHSSKIHRNGTDPMNENPALNGQTPNQKRRSTVCTSKNADAICARLIQGDSLRRICEDKGLPSYDTILNWALDEPDGFGAKYDRARKIQAHRYADEIIDLADDSSGDVTQDEKGNNVVDYENIQRSRLRVEARKWIVSKLLPKKYGDKPNEIHVSTAVNSGFIVLTEATQRELQARREADLRR